MQLMMRTIFRTVGLMDFVMRWIVSRDNFYLHLVVASLSLNTGEEGYGIS